MYVPLHVKYLLLSDFNETSTFSTHFEKNIQISNLMKIRPAGAELFYLDRQTDMTKLTVAFRYFANASKNIMYIITLCMFFWGDQQVFQFFKNKS
jgi:hypothetical protein